MNRNLTLQLERYLPAPPQRIFQAWTDPSALRKWFAPPGCVAESVSIDLQVGGEFRFRLRHLASGSGISIWGDFLEIVPEKLLVSSWVIEQPPQDPCETRLRVAFEPRGEGTLVGLTHEMLPGEASVQAQREALECCLERLAWFLEGKPLPLEGGGKQAASAAAS